LLRVWGFGGWSQIPPPPLAQEGSSSQVSELEGHEGDVTAVVVMAAAAPPTTAAKLAGSRWTAGLDGGAHLLGLPGRGGGAEGPGRAPRPLHGKLNLLWLLIGFYAELREFEINFANVHAYHLIL